MGARAWPSSRRPATCRTLGVGPTTLTLQPRAQAIHSCAVRFPDVAASVVHLLMDFLGDLNTAPALDVVFFVREIMETNPKLRPTILARLLDSFGTIRSSRVCTCALWIVGEYCASAADIASALEARAEGSLSQDTLTWP